MIEALVIGALMTGAPTVVSLNGGDQDRLYWGNRLRSLVLRGKRKYRRWPFDSRTVEGQRIRVAVEHLNLNQYIPKSEARCVSPQRRTDVWHCAVRDNESLSYRVITFVNNNGRYRKVIK